MCMYVWVLQIYEFGKKNPGCFFFFFFFLLFSEIGKHEVSGP